MTLLGEPERIHAQNTEQLHEHECHQNVTETSGHRMTQKAQTQAQHRNCESGYSWWSSPAGTSHTVYMRGCAAHWQYIMCSAGHMGHDVASLHQDDMDSCTVQTYISSSSNTRWGSLKYLDRKAIWRGIVLLCSILPHLGLRKIPTHSCNTSTCCPPIWLIVHIYLGPKV